MSDTTFIHTNVVMDDRERIEEYHKQIRNLSDAVDTLGELLTVDGTKMRLVKIELSVDFRFEQA